MSKRYHVSHDGEQTGPWDLDEIVGQIKQGDLTIMDYIYDDASADWIAFVEHSGLMAKVKEQKPKAPPKAQASSEQTEDTRKPSRRSTDASINAVIDPDDMSAEWYVLKGDTKYGPFDYTEVVKMLQEKVVFEFDFVWKPGMESWQRLADLNSFNHENISQLKSTLMPEIKDVFYRRKHKRALFSGSVIVHDNKSVWKGSGTEISGGGAGVVMHNAIPVPGDVLNLHFKPFNDVPAFNARCEIVSKKYEDGVKQKGSAVKYGLKFIEINKEAQQAVQNYSLSAKPAA